MRSHRMRAAQPRGSIDPRYKRERFFVANGPCRLDSNNTGGLDKGALSPYVARAERLAHMCLAAAGSSPAALRLNSLEQPNPFSEVQFAPRHRSENEILLNLQQEDWRLSRCEVPNIHGNVESASVN